MAPPVAEAILQALVQGPAALGGARDSPSSSPDRQPGLSASPPVAGPQPITRAPPHPVPPPPVPACPQHLARAAAAGPTAAPPKFLHGEPLSTASEHQVGGGPPTQPPAAAGTTGAVTPSGGRGHSGWSSPCSGRELSQRRSPCGGGEHSEGVSPAAGGTTASGVPCSGRDHRARCTPCSSRDHCARRSPAVARPSASGVSPAAAGSPESGFPPAAGGTTVDGVPSGSRDRREGAPPCRQLGPQGGGVPHPRAWSCYTRGSGTHGGCGPPDHLRDTVRRERHLGAPQIAPGSGAAVWRPAGVTGSWSVPRPPQPAAGFTFPLTTTATCRRGARDQRLPPTPPQHLQALPRPH